MNRNLLIALAAVLVVAGAWYWWQTSETLLEYVPLPPTHFIDSTPSRGEVYAAQPVNVTLNFNTDLGSDSTVTVRSPDGWQWQQGNIAIEDFQTALKAPLKANLPDGEYAVDYQACFIDRSCEQGSFPFSIDSSRKSDYQDKRGQKQLTIVMQEIAFQEPRLIISPGTAVTWVNEDSVGHYVNTETHPEHTYFTDQNSREIAPGKSFTTIFVTPGQYNYHCSAHVPEGMLGSIIVEE